MAKVREQLQNPQALLVMFAIGLVLTYAMATRAIDTGSLGQYGLTFLLFFLSVHLLAKTIRTLKDGNKR